MFKLYKITLARAASVEDFQPVLVSAENLDRAVSTARDFIEREYPGQVAPVDAVSDSYKICMTPDSVCDWA